MPPRRPHAIPVSTAPRRRRRRPLALATRARRSPLAEDPRCARRCCRRRAVTAYARASVVDEDDRVAFVRLDVESVEDHDQPTFELTGGVRWHWTDDGAERGDAAVRDRLRRL